MSIGYVGPAFTGDEQKHGSTLATLLGAGVTSGIGALAGGYGFQQNITPSRLENMSEDTFTKTFKDVPKEKNGIITELQEALKRLTPDSIDSFAKDVTQNTESISVKNFVTSFFGPTMTAASLKETIEKAPEDTKKLQTELNSAEEALKKAPEDKNAKQAVEEAVAALESHLDSVSILNSAQRAIDSAKEDKIGIDAIKTYTKEISLLDAGNILKGLGKDIPKVFSGRNALIGGGIGLLLAGIGNLIFGKHNN